MATDINLNQLVINKLTNAQYQAAKEANQLVDTEIYLTIDDTAPIFDIDSEGNLFITTSTAPSYPEAEDVQF